MRAVTNLGRPVRSVSGDDIVEKLCAADQFGSQRRRGVVVLDGEEAARAQPAAGEPDDGSDHRHPVRAAEHRMGRIMVRDFGFELDAIGHIGRVGHHEVDLPVELGKQARVGDVSVQ